MLRLFVACAGEVRDGHDRLQSEPQAGQNRVACCPYNLRRRDIRTLAGYVAGRAHDRLILASGEATTIDCCSVAQCCSARARRRRCGDVWHFALESSLRLDVSATFTAVSAEGTSPSIDAERIDASEKRLREASKRPEAPQRRRDVFRRNPHLGRQDIPSRQKPRKAATKSAAGRTRANKGSKSRS